jgi:hypothetical protein
MTPTGAIVVNMIGQAGLMHFKHHKRRPVQYVALVDCMRSVAKWIHDCHSDRKYEIHAPKFGAGRARGDWYIISALIEEIWCDSGIPVTIYSL